MKKIRIYNENNFFGFREIEETTRFACLKAIEHDADQLEYIPIQDKEIVLKALEQDGMLIQYVNENIIDKDIIVAAIKSDYESLEIIDKKYINKNIANIAIKTNIESVEYLDKKFITKDVIKRISKECGWLLPSFVDLIDDELIIEIIKISPKNYKYLKEIISDDIIFKIFMETRGKILDYLPSKKITKEMIKELENYEFFKDINIDFYNFIEDIPRNWKTRKLERSIKKYNPYLLRYFDNIELDSIIALVNDGWYKALEKINLSKPDFDKLVNNIEEGRMNDFLRNLSFRNLLKVDDTIFIKYKPYLRIWGREKNEFKRRKCELVLNSVDFLMM